MSIPQDFESQRGSYQSVRQLLFSAIERRRPFSLLRIGDGESVILSSPSNSNLDLAHHLRLWFGEPLPSPRRIAWLRSQLVNACRQATVLGIPTLRQCGLHPRYATSYQELSQLGLARRGVLCADAAVHRFLHLSGDLVATLSAAPFIGLVTSRNVLSAVADVCQPLRLHWHAVPPERPDPGASRLQWFPHRFTQLRRELRPPVRGSVYLVGAGLMGKLICELIRSRGGIALDLGSVFDGWALQRTRSYLERDLNGSYSLHDVAEVAQLPADQRLSRLVERVKFTEEDPGSFRLLNP